MLNQKRSNISWPKCIAHLNLTTEGRKKKHVDVFNQSMKVLISCACCSWPHHFYFPVISLVYFNVSRELAYLCCILKTFFFSPVTICNYLCNQFYMLGNNAVVVLFQASVYFFSIKIKKPFQCPYICYVSVFIFFFFLQPCS